jgi:hypothetical protein
MPPPQTSKLVYAVCRERREERGKGHQRDHIGHGRSVLTRDIADGIARRGPDMNEQNKDRTASGQQSPKQRPHALASGKEHTRCDHWINQQTGAEWVEPTGKRPTCDASQNVVNVVSDAESCNKKHEPIATLGQAGRLPYVHRATIRPTVAPAWSSCCIHLRDRLPLQCATCSGSLILVGIAVPPIGTAAAVGTILFFVDAIITHLRARWYSFGYPAAYLLLAVAALVLADSNLEGAIRGGSSLT